jgi:hypothetical protein
MATHPHEIRAATNGNPRKPTTVTHPDDPPTRPTRPDGTGRTPETRDESETLAWAWRGETDPE